MRTTHRVIATLLAVASIGPALSAQAHLFVSGEIWQGGRIRIGIQAPQSVGQVPVLLIGREAPSAPIPTALGSLYVFPIAVRMPLEEIPANGNVFLETRLPSPSPSLVGVTMMLQGVVAGALTNPAAVPLDVPYFTDTHTTSLSSPAPEDLGSFGGAQATGDFNDDGFIDVVAGAWLETDAGLDNAGHAYVFWGPTLSVCTTINDPAPAAWREFGASLAVGDLDHDGIDDLVIGDMANPLPGHPTDHGSLWIYHGNAAGSFVPSQQILSPDAGPSGFQFGRWVTTGDFNDDGWLDLCDQEASAPVAGKNKAGLLLVYFGPDFSTHTTLPNPSPDKDDYFGSRHAIGDVNGDGIDDLIEGSSRDHVAGVQNVGSVHVFAGPDLHLAVTLDNPLGVVAEAQFGQQVHGADVNQDGFGDVLVADGKGHVYVYWGPALTTSLVILRPATPFPWTSNPADYGFSIDCGDVNADGFVDVAIGDLFEGEQGGCGLQNGTVHVALGPYYNTLLRLHDAPQSCEDLFGLKLSLRNLDADDRLELIVSSAEVDENAPPDCGNVTVFDLN